jgi:hypothetical protein
MFIPINDSIINHFGKNPINGGSPPKDSKDKNIKNFTIELLLNNPNIWLILNNLKLLNIKIIAIDKKL